VKGMILTHGHEDHIGSIPYLLKELDVPIYGTKLTLGLVGNKLKEHGLKAKLILLKPGQTVRIGEFKVEAIRTTHSIADAICLAIDTPVGLIFHSGTSKSTIPPWMVNLWTFIG
jgi:ribonuclease J